MSAIPGWYIQLTGHPYDLELWEKALVPPSQVRMVRLEPDQSFFLSSERWSQLTDASEVRTKAEALVEQLNASFAILKDAEALTTQGVIRLDTDGLRHTYIFPETAFLKFRGFAPTLVAYDQEGNIIPPSPTPARLNIDNWIELGLENDDVADMLAFAAREGSWFDLYKACELAERLVGGERRLIRLLAPSIPYKMARQTANFYRHARAPKPDQMMTLREAKGVMFEAVKAAMATRIESS